FVSSVGRTILIGHIIHHTFLISITNAFNFRQSTFNLQSPHPLPDETGVFYSFRHHNGISVHEKTRLERQENVFGTKRKLLGT
ncbi:MAG: hypothetical protein Q4E71_07735, partial [Prevotella sp.]|nr:hypothetical protein [Prevotella sp.]